MKPDEMLAGREMDMLVAEKVIGPEAGMPPLPYSTEISAAWEAAEVFEFVRITNRDHTNQKIERRFHVEVGTGGQFYEARGDTAPLAICRAALKAKGVT